MQIQGISGLQPLAAVNSAIKTEQPTGEFANILSDAINNAQQTNAAAQDGTLGLLTGNVNDIAGTIIDGEKADVALRLTIQIRNKVIDAYNEVMRMQV